MGLILLILGYITIGVIIGLVNIWYFPNSEDVVGGSVLLVFLWLPLLCVAILMSPVMLLIHFFDKVQTMASERRRKRRGY